MASQLCYGFGVARRLEYNNHTSLLRFNMNPQTVQKNHVIYLQLDVIDENGALLESNADGDAFAYIHGQGIILPRLEDALDGHSIDDFIEVSIEPMDGYGERIEDAVITLPRDQLEKDFKVAINKGVSVQGPNGLFELYIIDFDEKTVTLDANHPYAGKTLTFKAKILTIRPAHHDEIWHRRVHPGGHHLMVSDSSYLGE